MTAKEEKGFQIYFAQVEVEHYQIPFLVTAFFDDYDEPLIIRTPLDDEESCKEFLELLSQGRLEVYFFDEHSRELLGYQSKIDEGSKLKSIKEEISLIEFANYPNNSTFWGKTDDQIRNWFGNRRTADDREALSVHFEKELYPEDNFIIDSKLETNPYHAYRTPMFTQLERQNSGLFQELDLVKTLGHVFKGEQIYYHPMRLDNGREFVDILVVTSNNIFLIQAKDSPNTTEILQRSIDRKKATTNKHINKASSQLSGSISYILNSNVLQFKIDEEQHEVILDKKKIYGLIIVRELFSDEFRFYSQVAFELFDDTSVHCVIFDYPEFHQWMFYCGTEDIFVNKLDFLIMTASRRGEFPRIRWWPNINNFRNL